MSTVCIVRMFINRQKRHVLQSDPYKEEVISYDHQVVLRLNGVCFL